MLLPNPVWTPGQQYSPSWGLSLLSLAQPIWSPQTASRGQSTSPCSTAVILLSLRPMGWSQLGTGGPAETNSSPARQSAFPSILVCSSPMGFLIAPAHTMCHAFAHAGFHTEGLTPFLWLIHPIIQVFTECLMCRHCVKAGKSNKNKLVCQSGWCGRQTDQPMWISGW